MTEKEENYKKHMDILDAYTEEKSLSEYDIIHIYPKEQAYPDGYCDSKFFTCVFFNTITDEKRTTHNHDGIEFFNKSTDIRMIRVYVDGSIMIRFRDMKKLNKELTSLIFI